MVLRDAQARDAEGFRREAEAVASLRDLTVLFTAAMRPFGVIGYAIGHLHGAARPAGIFITTWPRAWMELYAANGFIRIDPIVAEAIASPDPFTWEAVKQRRPFDPAMLDAARRFGFHQGFAVPIHGPGDARGVVALAATRLRIGAEDEPLVIAKSRYCYSVARRLYDRLAGPVALPPREREALALVAQGFEDAAIGAAMGISRTSAHVYVERAKRRLGATTRAQAVAMAMADGIL